MINRPILSVVIANYNYGRFLEEAIQSILSQGMDDKVEIIVCDAASTDNSVEVIKKFAKGLPPNTYLSQSQPSSSTSITWWCSEKDGGQSAAFNKGFKHARGEWLTWLNADDLYLPGTLKALFELIEQKPSAQWITGNKVHFDSETRKIISVNWGPHCQLPLLSRRMAFSAVFGPTTFWKKSLYEKAGPIDEQLHFAMDSEYWARLTMMGVRQTRLRHLCWAFRDHVESKTAGVQSEEVRLRRLRETAYWHSKIGYDFAPTFKNPYYIVWILWRLFDGSWIRRAVLKLRFEGRDIGCLGEKGELD